MSPRRPVRLPVSGVATRAARWSATHPWRALLAWLAMVCIAIGSAVAVSTVETTDADYRIGESGRASAWTEQAGMEAAPSEKVLITSEGDLDVGRAKAAANELRRDLDEVEGVTHVSGPLWSADRSTLLLDVRLARDDLDPTPLTDVTSRVDRAHPNLTIEQAGDLTVVQGIEERVGEDLHSAEGASIPVTLVLMLLAFGALIAAGIPVLLAVTSVAAAIGLSAPLSHLMPADNNLASMVVLIGMAVGVDYSLFYLKREREERSRGRSVHDAVELAAETSGHSILVSGAAVMVSLAGLYVIGDATFNSLATGAIVVVAVAVVGSITVLPALLVLLGRWVDRPRVPLLWRLNRRIGQGGISRRVLGPVVGHPVAALVLAGGIVLGLAAPTLGMKLHSGGLQTLPGDIPAVATMNRVVESFPTEGSTAEVVVHAAPGARDDVAAALTDLDREAGATDSFVGADSPQLEVSRDQTTSVLQLAMPWDESDERVESAIEQLRTELAPAALDGLDAEYAVGGSAAESHDFVDRLRERLPLVIGVVLALTLVMMALVFGSLLVALVTMVLNLASVGAAFGLMTLVFQHGWGSGLLGFTTPGFVIDWIPLFVMVVLVGLSMDYHVFVLSRVREHVQNGMPPREAVRRGISDTAGVVTSAGAVMVSVFAIFAGLSMMEMKMMGVGLAGAILLDATIVRLVILPAVLVLLGDRAWPRARSGRPGHQEAPAMAAEPELAVR